MICMQPKTSLLTIALIVAMCLLFPVHQATAAGTHSHTHGEAQLTIAMQGEALEIELVSPAANIVGFEHAPHSEQDQSAIKNAFDLLRTPNHVIILQGGKCAHIDTTFSPPLASLVNDQAHNAEPPTYRHSDISARYKYQCKKGALPTSATVSIFQHFPATQKIKLLWAQQSNQGIDTLTPKKPNVYFE